MHASAKPLIKLLKFSILTACMLVVRATKSILLRKKHVFALAKEGDSRRRLSSLSSSSGNIAVRET